MTSLLRSPKPVGQQNRWLDLLSENFFVIEHRAGNRQGNADGLSRRPCGSRRCTRTDCLEGTFDGGMHEWSESAADEEPPIVTIAKSNEDPLPETSGLEYHCSVQRSDGSENSEALTLENIRRHQEDDPLLTFERDFWRQILTRIRWNRWRHKICLLAICGVSHGRWRWWME